MGLGFGIWDLGFGVWNGLGLRWGFGFGVGGWDLGFWVRALGFGVLVGVRVAVWELGLGFGVGL